MENSTTIKNLLSQQNIFVPNYQRAYSWDTQQIEQFYQDLEDYIHSRSSLPYYFGHFLFEEDITKKSFGVIDGQQRITTIVIFLSALFEKLKTIRKLTEEEIYYYNSMIKLGGTYKFKTVQYDNQYFIDYVINHNYTSSIPDTISKQRIKQSFDNFTKRLDKLSEETIVQLLSSIAEAKCTTHLVKNETEAIQMFIFQNNRGKRPSHLEIIKAQFMYHIHLYATEEEKDNLMYEIKNRFETIYKSISQIESQINEDNILNYTLCVYFKSLYEDSIDKINKELEHIDTCIHFIKNFTMSLTSSFEQILKFYQLEKENIHIHTLNHLGHKSILFPFIIKILANDKTKKEDIEKVAIAFECLFFRDRIIGTRANLISRLQDTFKTYDGDINPIIERIQYLKQTSNWWWAYWNNTELEKALRNCWFGHDTAKLLLWQYENFLLSKGKIGYKPKRYDEVDTPHLEHIAPKTENPETGYAPYDEDFTTYYLDNLGNYLLLSSSHNISIGNRPFEEKRATYTQLLQQQEVKDMTETNHYWDKEKIATRQSKIIDFILNTF